MTLTPSYTRHREQQQIISISSLYQQRIRKMITRHQHNQSCNRQEITLDSNNKAMDTSITMLIDSARHLLPVRCIIPSTKTITPASHKAKQA